MTTIEAARIINAIKCSTVTTPKEHEALTMAECVLFEQERKSAPTAEAEPKHGRNIADGRFSRGYENTSARIFLCSECRYGFDDIYLCNERDYPIEPNYCPNCGAKVDEVEE